jgi:hypothetical protein
MHRTFHWYIYKTMSLQLKEHVNISTNQKLFNKHLNLKVEKRININNQECIFPGIMFLLLQPMGFFYWQLCFYYFLGQPLFWTLNIFQRNEEWNRIHSWLFIFILFSTFKFKNFPLVYLQNNVITIEGTC